MKMDSFCLSRLFSVLCYTSESIACFNCLHQSSWYG